VKSRRVIRTNRPIEGLVAFAPGLPMTVAMGSLGTCDFAMHQAYPMSCRFEPSIGGWQLDRNEDRMHPGGGST